MSSGEDSQIAMLLVGPIIGVDAMVPDVSISPQLLQTHTDVLREGVEGKDLVLRSIDVFDGRDVLTPPPLSPFSSSNAWNVCIPT